MPQTNFGKAYVEYAAARTDAPLAFHRYAAVAVCGAALGNRLYMDAGWGNIYPSTWTCFIGRSGVRKTTSGNLAASLLAKADKTLMLPHDFSREALYEQLAAHACGLLWWREMGSVLKVMKRDYNSGVKETLTDFWDSPDTVVRRTLKSGMLEFERPAITILAAAKPRWFVENTSREDIEGGFIGRWMFVSADANNGNGKFFGTPTSSAQGIQRDSLVEHLRGLTRVGTNEPRQIMPSTGARDTLERWLRGFQAEWQDEDKDPADFSQRAGTQVIKLAMGILACRGTDDLSEIPPQAIKQAIELFEYSFGCSQALIRMITGHSQEADTLEVVRRIIRNEGTIHHSALLRKTKMKARTLNECMETLIAADEVVRELEDRATGSGRQPVVYRYAG